MCPIGLRIARARLRILLSPALILPSPIAPPARTCSIRAGPLCPAASACDRLRRGRQRAGHDRDECDGQPEYLNWHGEEVEHRLSYLSVHGAFQCCALSFAAWSTGLRSSLVQNHHADGLCLGGMAGDHCQDPDGDSKFHHCALCVRNPNPLGAGFPRLPTLRVRANPACPGPPA